MSTIINKNGRTIVVNGSVIRNPWISVKDRLPEKGQNEVNLLINAGIVDELADYIKNVCKVKNRTI